MKIKFTLGPYGYEVVLGSITEKIYNQYCEDNDALRDAVSGFEENSGMKEWSENDDINHIYGAVLEEEGTDQYLAILDDQGNEILNTPLHKSQLSKVVFYMRRTFLILLILIYLNNFIFLDKVVKKENGIMKGSYLKLINL